MVTFWNTFFASRAQCPTGLSIHKNSFGCSFGVGIPLFLENLFRHCYIPLHAMICVTIAVPCILFADHIQYFLIPLLLCMEIGLPIAAPIEPFVLKFHTDFQHSLYFSSLYNHLLVGKSYMSCRSSVSLVPF